MKGIIKFYLKNKKISNIGIVALVICISYIITYNMPDYLGIEPFLQIPAHLTMHSAMN